MAPLLTLLSAVLLTCIAAVSTVTPPANYGAVSATATASPTPAPPCDKANCLCCLQNQIGTPTVVPTTQAATGSAATPAPQTPPPGGQSSGSITYPAQPLPPVTICGPDRDACAGSGPGLPTPYPPLDLTHGAPSGSCLRYVRTPGGGPVELHLSWCGTTIDVTPVPAGS